MMMKDMKGMPKDWMEHKIHKLYHKRNFLLRAFLINYVAVFVAWLITMIPGYQEMAMHFLQTDAAETHMFIMDIFGLWKILGVVLFLVPALAAWWEMHACKKALPLVKGGRIA